MNAHFILNSGDIIEKWLCFVCKGNAHFRTHFVEKLCRKTENIGQFNPKIVYKGKSGFTGKDDLSLAWFLVNSWRNLRSAINLLNPDLLSTQNEG